ncbi:mur ligase middle domain protein, partial [Chlamydia psittaci 84-8471/1]
MLPSSGLAVVNNDLHYAAQFIEATQAQPITYGIEQHADYRASNLRFSPFGTDFDLLYKGETFACSSPL